MPFRRPKMSSVRSQQAIEMKAQSGLFKCLNWILFLAGRGCSCWFLLCRWLGCIFRCVLCSSTNCDWLVGLINASLALNWNHCHTMNVRTRACVSQCLQQQPWMSTIRRHFSSLAPNVQCANHTHQAYGRKMSELCFTFLFKTAASWCTVYQMIHRFVY